MSVRLLVPDSGPLIALARLDLLALPASLYGDVLVPDVVWDDVFRQPPEVERQRLSAAAEAGHLKVVAAAQVATRQPSDPRLGAGERAAIELARSRQAQVLIDERRGRRAATEAGLVVVGTVGLLVRGRQLGLVGPLRPVLQHLRSSGSHLSQELTVHALSVLGE